jgi:magnesium-transporting ATPase (P-type)
MAEPKKTDDNVVLELIRLVDKKYKRSIWDIFLNPHLMTLVILVMLLIIVEAYLVSVKDIGEQLKIMIPFVALIIAFFAVFEKGTDEASIKGNYKRLRKEKMANENNNHLLRSLIIMKNKHNKINLEQVYNMNKELFAKEKLLEKLYE